MSWSRIDDMLDPRARELLHGRHLMLNDQNQHFRMGVPDGVQIVGFTPDMKVVAITEEKADGSVYTHLPSGMVDKDEAFVRAAGREFAEETGYRFERLVRLTTAKQSSAHLIGDDVTFVALGCVKDSDCQAKPDKSEKILKVEELAPEALKRKMQDELLRDPTKSVSGRNSYASLSLAMMWAEKAGLLDKPVTETSPLVIAVVGLPTTGKSTLARALSGALEAHVLDIDEGPAHCAPVQETDPYRSDEARARERARMTVAYTTMHAAVTANLLQGFPVIVTATYSRHTNQDFLIEAVKKGGGRLKIVWCQYDDSMEEIERRIQDRLQRGATGGCRSVAHYLDDKGRYAGIKLPHFVTMMQGGEEGVKQAVSQVLEFVRS